MSRSKALQYYIMVRLLLAPMMLFTVTTIVFLLLRAKGDPVDAIYGNRVPESVKQALREQLGLTGPLWEQYLRYLGNLLRFDFGTSISSSGEPVWNAIEKYFPATVELAVFSIAIAFIVGVTVGVISASRPGTIFDAGGRLFGIISYSLPIFWAGMVLQLIFSVQLHWFPLGGRFPPNLASPEEITGIYTLDSILTGNFNQFFTCLHHLALPSLTLGILLSGIFERIVRVNLKKTLKADYVEAARARGISESKILVSHALKNALIPVITILGLTLPHY